MTQVRNKTNHNGFNFLQSVCQGCILCVLFACLSARAQDSSAKNHQDSKVPTVNADSSVAQSEKEDSTAKSPAKPSLASLDEKLTLKGNDNPYPGFEEGMLGDMGGVRTALAKVGIGIIGTNSFIYERNVLDTPRHAPTKYDSTFYRGKAYIGEDDTYVNDANVAITYDMSRYKIPDGQLIVQFAKSDCNDGYYFGLYTRIW